MNFTDSKAVESELKSGLVVVTFSATWCGPCKIMQPELQKMSEKYSDIKVFKINVEEARDLSKEHSVSSVPHTVAFRDGVVVKTMGGWPGKQKLDEFFASLHQLSNPA